MSRPDDEVTLFEEDSTEALAREVGVSLEDFVEVFGTDWRLVPDQGIDFDADPDGVGNLYGPWYVAGEPYQLMLRPGGDGVELGIPAGQWAGAHTLSWQSHDRHFVPGTGPSLLVAAAPIVAHLLKRRRASFRYCRYCRRITPPEERLERDVCYGCGTAVRGIIY